MVMNFGQKIAQGIPGEIMENQEVKEAYIGTEIS
jgi:ABC-type branched-subunit amino acid transport system ATPase component